MNLDSFARTDTEETSTLCCKCGETFTWSGYSADLYVWAAQHALHVDAPGWKRMPLPEIPKCDLCQAAAKWLHPQGGLRCDLCPRPEACR
jgi:hypothetical protein